METGYLPLIGLRDVMCHMVASVSPGKEGGWPSEMQLRNHYVDGLHKVTRRVQCNQML